MNRSLLAVLVILLAPMGAALTAGDVLVPPTEISSESSESSESPQPSPVAESTQPTSESPAAMSPGMSGPSMPTRADRTAWIESTLPEGYIPDTWLNFQSQPNGTNETSINEEHGTVSHRHAHLGEQGLSPVWAAAFYGDARVMIHMDIDGDATQDTVIGTSIAIVAVSGADATPIWAHHIGSRVTSLFPIQADGDGPMEIGFSTAWGGQNGQVSVLRANDGHEVWAYFDERSFIAAGPLREDSGEVIAVDSRGLHHRIASGELVRTTDARLGGLPIGLYDFGAYDAVVADVNGDGTMDSVSMHVTWLFEYLPQVGRVERDQILVNAIDGNTGERLWVHEAGGPPTDFFSWMFPYDLIALDHNGDGAQDIAFTASSTTYFCEVQCQVFNGAHMRVINGASTGVGVPLGIRDVVTPNLRTDSYYDLAKQDVNGDGADELAVVHFSAVNNLQGTPYTVERYAHLASGSGMALMSDVQVPTAGAVMLGPSFEKDGDDLIPIMWNEGLTGFADIMGPDATMVGELSYYGALPRVVSHDGSGFLIGNTEGLEVRPDLSAEPTKSFAMRGQPYVLQAGDYDGDKFDDMWVVSSDGNVYVLDGLTGGVLLTVDRDDVIVDLFLQDADGDKDIDPYFMILKQGESVNGLFFTYTAETELYDLELDESVWRSEGFPYRDLWFDANGDGVLDFISDYDYDIDFTGSDWSTTITTTVTDGATGEEIYSTSNKAPGFFFANNIIAYDLDGGAGLVLADRTEGMLILDGEGKKVTSVVFDDWYWGMCLAAADLNGDKVDEIYVAISNNDGTSESLYAPDGSSAPIDIIGDMEINGCTVATVRDGKSDDLLIMAYEYEDGDINRLIARYGEEGVVWSDESKQGTPGNAWIRYIGHAASDPDGGRFYYGYQDHVLSRSWKTGEIVAQFTVNGPFVLNGAMIELDNRAPTEIVALTSDGLLWALAADKEAVAAAAAKEAKSQGKEVLTEVDEVEDILASQNKESPSFALPLLLAGLVGVALRRRK